jgi:hypothetical protein
MKYVIIVYIALGFVLSMTVGIVYYCEGHEMYPEYFGSPFIFTRKSLGSSMTYYYSISGLILNIAIWSLVILFLRVAILKLIHRTGDNKSLKKIYRGIVVVLIAFTTLSVATSYIMLGHGFEEGFNYWYMDLDKEAERWGVNCEGKWEMFPG